MSDPQVAKIAREEAGKIRNQAVGALRKAAEEIAEAFKIPDGINGLSSGEYLGRVSFVVSMERDLRVAGDNLMAEKMLRSSMNPDAPGIDDLDHQAPPTPTKPPEPATKVPTATHDTLNLGDLPGITAQTLKALKSAGLHTVADCKAAADEHLLKINGIAEASLGQLRTAIAAYESGHGVTV